jgi:geranylgeranyl diphosphate synthase type II
MDTREMAQIPLAQAAAEVEAYLAEWLAGRALPENLRAAIRYAVLGGGKRVRPLLVRLSCEAVGGSRSQALPAAAAMELVHTFSLVHDDLPAMDDDDLRRGRPTLHRQTSEAMAILAGDAMLALAFELLANRVPSPGLAGSLCAELAVATDDMIAGQVYDTLPDFPESTPPLVRLQTIHRHKTGALIRCACRLGALSAGASDGRLHCITAYGEAIGLMFQVVDDLLDVTQTSEHLGKTARKDAEQGKLTYPAVLGVDASRREVERLHDEACRALESLGSDATPLRELSAWLAKRTR